MLPDEGFPLASRPFIFGVMFAMKAIGSAQENRLLLTELQAAAALSLSPRKLWSLRSSGDIAHLRIGRSVRYDIADLKEWIDRLKTLA